MLLTFTLTPSLSLSLFLLSLSLCTLLHLPVRFLCGTVNDFVAEVGKAYERATENKEEADAMAKKVNGVEWYALCKSLCNSN